MTKMKTEDLKSYQLRLQCQQCGKFIDIDFFVKINERNQYGKEEEIWPKKLPEYLLIGLENIGHAIDRYKNEIAYQPMAIPSWTPGPSTIQPVKQPEPILLCQECITLKALKE